jgi:hypothetical protein
VTSLILALAGMFMMECYGQHREPALADARWLFEWVVGSRADTLGFQSVEGPRVLIVGTPPMSRNAQSGAVLGGPAISREIARPRPQTVTAGR